MNIHQQKQAYDMIAIAAKVLAAHKPLISMDHDNLVKYNLWYEVLEKMGEEYHKAYPMVKVSEFMKMAGYGG